MILGSRFQKWGEQRSSIHPRETARLLLGDFKYLALSKGQDSFVKPNLLFSGVITNQDKSVVCARNSTVNKSYGSPCYGVTHITSNNVNCYGPLGNHDIAVTLEAPVC